ncbi:MAG: hypothetical protein ACLR2E_01755 [Lachnospiraceae bacterium]
MMAAVVVISLPLIVLFLVFREQIMEGGIKRRDKRDDKQMGKISGDRPSHSRCAFPHRLPRGEAKSRQRSSFRMTFDTSKDYEITFWAKNDTNIRPRPDIYKKAISDFQGPLPKHHGEPSKLYTDYGKIYNDVITNIATDTTPNVCITYPDHIATYLTGKDTVVPLDELSGG